MRRIDKVVVPVTFVLAMLAVLGATVTWVPRPVQLIEMRLTMGPPGIVPHHLYGLSFTPRNVLSGHILTTLIPAQRRCVDVTFTNSDLTFIDQERACRAPDGSYRLPYRFPHTDDYIVYAEMQPVGGPPQVGRIDVPLDVCWLRRLQHYRGHCQKRTPRVRGLDVVRTHYWHDLTIVLGAPAHAVQTGERVQVTFLFLRHGRAVPDLQAIGGVPGRAVAISDDTRGFVHLLPDAGQIVRGYVKSGAVTFSARFDYPSIYKVFGAFRYHGHVLHTSFVINVDPRPLPTPAAG